MLLHKSILKGEKVIILFLLFVFQACTYPSLEKEFPEINEIKKGDKFCIILPENHTENEFWRVKDSKKNCCEKINAVWHGNEKGIYFNYIGKSEGIDTLYFSKLKQSDTVKTASYIVKVIN